MDVALFFSVINHLKPYYYIDLRLKIITLTLLPLFYRINYMTI